MGFDFSSQIPSYTNLPPGNLDVVETISLSNEVDDDIVDDDRTQHQTKRRRLSDAITETNPSPSCPDVVVTNRGDSKSGADESASDLNLKSIEENYLELCNLLVSYRLP